MNINAAFDAAFEQAKNEQPEPLVPPDVEAQGMAILEEFDELVGPGWEEHQAKMFEVAQNVDPTGLSGVEYLQTLHREATKGVKKPFIEPRPETDFEKAFRRAKLGICSQR